MSPSSLADRLMAAIEEAQRDAHEIHDQGCFLFQDPGSGECSCEQSATVLRRCAADRKIVAECQRVFDQLESWTRHRLMLDSGQDMAYTLAETTLAALAEAYGVEVPATA